MGEKEGECPILMGSFPQQLHIPTMENGPELIVRFQKELKAIQVSSRAFRAAALINGFFPLNPCGQKHGDFLCFGSCRLLARVSEASGPKDRTSFS